MPIRWFKTPKKLDADPGATVALDRARWEQLGASFNDADDGNGETPGLATATVRTALGAIPVGVLDYGEQSTYLLVPDGEQGQLNNTAAVLLALQDAGALRLEDELLDVAGTSQQPTLEERVSELERQAGGEPEEPERIAVTVTAGLARQPGEAMHGVHAGQIKWFKDGVGVVRFKDLDSDVVVHNVRVVGSSYRALAKGMKVLVDADADAEIASPARRERAYRTSSARRRVQS